MFYSKETKGFYDSKIHGDRIPADAVEITMEYYAELLQAPLSGKIIVANESGYPIAIDPPQPVRTKALLLAEVAAKRWQVETSGIIIGDTPIATDRESQAQLTSSYTLLKSGLITNTPWKSADGRFTLVTLPDLEPIAQAVGAHVRACFAAEQSHNEDINALAAQSDLDDYDVDIGWPSGR